MPIPTRSLSQRQPRQLTDTTARMTTKTLIPKKDTYGAPSNSDRTLDTNARAAPNASGVGTKIKSDAKHRDNSTAPSERKSLLSQQSIQTCADGPEALNRQMVAGTQPPRDDSVKVDDHLKSTNHSTKLQDAVHSQDTTLSRIQGPEKPPIKGGSNPETARSNARKSLQLPVRPTISSTQNKGEMLPPPRPTRSASVRQPSTPAPAVSTGLKGHVRHRSQVVLPSSSQLKKQVEATSSAGVSRAKPSFSTYQQSFSPRKPSIPSSTARTTPASDADVVVISSSSEATALQTELLQLRLLHSSSLQRAVALQVESEERLRRKFDLVSEAYRSLVAKGKESQLQLNALALRAWMQDSHGETRSLPFSEQVQIFSRVLQEVSDLTDPGAGRYKMALDAFEDWFRHAQQIKLNRERLRPEILAGEELAFIDPLDHAWKHELGILLGKLELCARQLQSLDFLSSEEMRALPESALSRTATGLKEMLDLMIEEADAIRAIEADVVKSERAWLRQFTDRLPEIQTASMRDGAKPRVGVWKMAPLRFVPVDEATGLGVGYFTTISEEDENLSVSKDTLLWLTIKLRCNLEVTVARSDGEPELEKDQSLVAAKRTGYALNGLPSVLDATFMPMARAMRLSGKSSSNSDVPVQPDTEKNSSTGGALWRFSLGTPELMAAKTTPYDIHILRRFRRAE